MGNLNLPSDEIVEKVKSFAHADLTEARKINSKAERNEKVGEIRDRMLESCFAIPCGSYAEVKQAEKDVAWPRKLSAPSRRRSPSN